MNIRFWSENGQNGERDIFIIVIWSFNSLYLVLVYNYIEKKMGRKKIEIELI